MTDHFNTEEAIHNMGQILNLELEELPHYETINNFLEKLEPAELESIRTYMIKELIKKRCLESYIGEREYKDKETGEVTKTVYMHHVLEAKLVVGDRVLSIATKFIENETEDVSKQVCELKAFNRLADKLKTNFTRLPMIVSMHVKASVNYVMSTSGNFYAALKKAESQRSQKNLKLVRN